MGDSLPVVDLGQNRKAVEIAVGGGFELAHTCAILDTGDVKCWGLNASGQLGQQDKDNRGDNPNEMGDSLLAVALGADAYGIEYESQLIEVSRKAKKALADMVEGRTSPARHDAMSSEKDRHGPPWPASASTART